MNKETHNWEEVIDSNVYQEIIAHWEKLLQNNKLKEEHYHKFLASNPLIFLITDNSYFSISKLKISSRYITDFVIAKEGYSDGTKYELIEIESPHTKLFDSSGKPTAKFNSALQQIRDWRRYLIDNKTLFREIFPTANTKVIKDSKLSYKIIIGRTSSDKSELEKRRQISEENNVEIISFDRLTAYAKGRRYFDYEAQIYAAQMDDVPFYKKNQLANPFSKCCSDATWRKICYKGHSHFYYHMIDSIIESREHSEYFEKFKNEMKVKYSSIPF